MMIQQHARKVNDVLLMIHVDHGTRPHSRTRVCNHPAQHYNREHRPPITSTKIDRHRRDQPRRTVSATSTKTYHKSQLPQTCVNIRTSIIPNHTRMKIVAPLLVGLRSLPLASATLYTMIWDANAPITSFSADLQVPSLSQSMTTPNSTQGIYMALQPTNSAVLQLPLWNTQNSWSLEPIFCCE